MKKIDKKYYFIWASMLFLVIMIVVFGYRFIKAYSATHKNTDNVANLTTLLTANVQYTGDGVHRDGNTYYFYGTEVNNYVYFSGRTWRVIGVNSSGQIKMIEEEPETIIYYGANLFEDSYVHSWLEEKFLPTITASTYLVDGTYCVDSFEDVASCNDQMSYKAGLLSIDEYERVGGKNSYLNSGVYNWLINTNSLNNPWYISNEGTIGNASSITSLGVKPVITIKADIDIIGGDGTSNNPYIFSENNPKTIKDMNVGEYLSYNGYTWRIMSQGNTTKMVMADALDKKMIYSSYDNSYNVGRYNSVAYYLIREFYSGLDTSLIVDTTYNNGIYEGDYHSVSSTTIMAKVGLASIGDNFMYYKNSCFTINPTGKATQAVYTVLGEGRLNSDDIGVEEYVRPVITISNSSEIANGVGTYSNPYVVK